MNLMWNFRLSCYLLSLSLTLFGCCAFAQQTSSLLAPPGVDEAMDTTLRLSIPDLQVTASDMKFQIIMNDEPYGSPTSSLNHVIDELQPGGCYSFEYKVFKNGRVVGVSSAAAVFLRPTPPSYFSAGLNNGKIDLYWGESEGASGYQLFVDQSRPLLDFAASQTYATIDILNPGETRIFQMAAYNSGGYSAFSDSVTISVPSINLKINDITQTSAILEWNLIAGAESYGIVYSDENVYELNIGPLPASTSSYVIASGTPGTSFSARVIASMPGDLFQISNMVSILHLPETPEEPWIARDRHGKLKLEWFPVFSAKSYLVFADRIRQVGQIEAPTTEFYLELPDNIYKSIELSVVSVNETGRSQMSNPAMIEKSLDIKEAQPVSDSSEKKDDDAAAKERSVLIIGEKIANFKLPSYDGNDFLYYENGFKCGIFVFLPPANEETIRYYDYAASLVSAIGSMESPVIQIKREDDPPVIKPDPQRHYPYFCLTDKNSMVKERIFKITHEPVVVLVDKYRKVIALEALGETLTANRLLATLSELDYCKDLIPVSNFLLRKKFEKLHYEENK